MRENMIMYKGDFESLKKIASSMGGCDVMAGGYTFATAGSRGVVPFLEQMRYQHGNAVQQRNAAESRIAR